VTRNSPSAQHFSATTKLVSFPDPLHWTMDWTLDWTMDWTLDWNMDWTLDSIMDSIIALDF